jgi:hypothetical protein
MELKKPPESLILLIRAKRDREKERTKGWGVLNSDPASG